MKLDHYIVQHAKINSRWLKTCNVKREIIKQWEDHTGEHLYILGVGNDFFIKTQKLLNIKAKIDILVTLKLRTLAYQRHYKKVKHQILTEKIYFKQT